MRAIRKKIQRWMNCIVPSSCLIKELEKKNPHSEFRFQTLVEPNETANQPFTKCSLMFLKTTVCKKSQTSQKPVASVLQCYLIQALWRNSFGNAVIFVQWAYAGRLGRLYWRRYLNNEPLKSFLALQSGHTSLLGLPLLPHQNLSQN